MHCFRRRFRFTCLKFKLRISKSEHFPVELANFATKKTFASNSNFFLFRTNFQSNIEIIHLKTSLLFASKLFFGHLIRFEPSLGHLNPLQNLLLDTQTGSLQKSFARTSPQNHSLDTRTSQLISTVFIICLFGKLINCNNNNDQSKSSPSDKPAVAAAPAASNQAQQPADSLKLESRQIPVAASPHQYVDRSDGSVQHVAINTHNLSPKESAYHNANPNAPVGYIQIQPVLAPLAAHHTPEQQGSTSFISFIKPQQAGGRRSFSLTNKLKNFMSSLFWK